MPGAVAGSAGAVVPGAVGSAGAAGSGSGAAGSAGAAGSGSGAEGSAGAAGSGSAAAGSAAVGSEEIPSPFPRPAPSAGVFTGAGSLGEALALDIAPVTILKLGSRSGGCRSGSFPSLKSFYIILNHVLLF